MADPDLDGERRELERRAFARDGSGLSEAEAARLSALRRADAPLTDALPVVPGPEQAQRDESLPSTAPVSPTSSRSADGSGDHLGDAGPRQPIGAVQTATGTGTRLRAWLATGAWKRPRYVVGGLALVLLAGLVVGWAIPRPPDVGLALRAGEGEREAAVLKQSDDLDPGTLLLLARDHDGLLWYATQAGGRLHCAILDVRGASAQRECQTAEQVRERPLMFSLPQPIPGQRDGYAATLAIAGTGAPMGVLQSYQMTYTMSAPQDLREQAAMNRIVADNGFIHAMVVGRVGDVPVWLGDDGAGNRCLIVEDPDPRKACDLGTVTLDFAARDAPGQERPTLALRLPETASHPALRIEFWTPANAGQYLVITQDDALFHFGDRAAD